MAFVVETGSGLANATAYVDVAFFKDYHKDRGTTISQGGGEIRAAIVKATDFIDRRYRARIVGIRLNVNQSLEFPRTNAFYQDGRVVLGVPIEIQQAIAELGFRALTADLAPDPVYDESNRIVVARDERVGPISESVRFSDDQVILSWRKFPQVEGLIRELIVEGAVLQRA